MIPNLLLAISAPILAIYFYQFGKTMNLLGEDEKKRYTKKAASKMAVILEVFLFAAFFYFDSFKLKLLFGIGIILCVAIATYIHHRKLRLLNFDKAFEKRLMKVSFLSGIGIALILASFIMDSSAT